MRAGARSQAQPKFTGLGQVERSGDAGTPTATTPRLRHGRDSKDLGADYKFFSMTFTSTCEPGIEVGMVTRLDVLHRIPRLRLPMIFILYSSIIN